MANEATFSVTGYVATPPKSGYTRDGTRTLYMRVGWTPRRIDKRTGEWTDQPTSFVSVTCYRKVAENAAACLRRGDPIVLKGTLRVREYGDDKRVTVDVFADSIGHDLSRGVTIFKKSTEQLEQTALERERAMAAVGREPLPGDRPVYDSRNDEPSTGEPAGQPDEMGPGLGGPDSEGAPDSDDDETFDEDEARRMLAQAGESAEPVAVSA
jgi:single-strand DNA-binding protein